MSFNENLKKQCNVKNNRLCIGLDFDNKWFQNDSLDYMQGFIKDVIESTIDLCPVYKINFAFYEKHGFSGYKILEKIPSFVNGRAVTIADAKRGDIGNSSKYYAESIFDYLNYDSMTVSPYMGHDSLEPFTKYKDKGVFILALTSNPGSGNFQKMIFKSDELYKHVIRLANDLNSSNNVGLVVGATNYQHLGEIKKEANLLPWLMPGIGFQGGNLKKSVTIGEDSYLSLVNVSRGIIRAGDGSISAIRNETKKYTQKIREIL